MNHLSYTVLEEKTVTPKLLENSDCCRALLEDILEQDGINLQDWFYEHQKREGRSKQTLRCFSEILCVLGIHDIISLYVNKMQLCASWYKVKYVLQ